MSMRMLSRADRRRAAALNKKADVADTFVGVYSRTMGVLEASCMSAEKAWYVVGKNEKPGAREAVQRGQLVVFLMHTGSLFAVANAVGRDIDSFTAECIEHVRIANAPPSSPTAH